MANDIANIRTGQVAAATAVVGYDLLTGVPENRLPYSRIMDGFALTGANAVGECVVDVIVNGVKKGTYSNTSTGVGLDQNKDLMGMDLFIPSNHLLQVVVKNAPTVSPVVCQMEFHKPKSSGNGQKRYTRSSGARRPAGSASTRRTFARRQW